MDVGRYLVAQVLPRFFVEQTCLVYRRRHIERTGGQKCTPIFAIHTNESINRESRRNWRIWFSFKIRALNLNKKSSGDDAMPLNAEVGVYSSRL